MSPGDRVKIVAHPNGRRMSRSHREFGLLGTVVRELKPTKFQPARVVVNWDDGWRFITNLRCVRRVRRAK